MAVLLAGSNFQIDMIGDDDGVRFPTITQYPTSQIISSTATHVIERYDDGWYNSIYGTGLTANAEDVTGGTVTSIYAYSSDPTAPGAVPDLGLVGVNFDVAAQPESASPFGATGLSGDDTVLAGKLDDLVRGFTGADLIGGGDGNDMVFGNQGSDILYGELGDDALYGGQGNDALYGAEGADALYGNLADDTLFGGAGNDTLIGGGGADTFVFGKGSGTDADRVADFSAAEGDHIRITDGLTYTVASDAAGNAVLHLSSGDTATLVGVAAADVRADWFVAA